MSFLFLALWLEDAKMEAEGPNERAAFVAAENGEGGRQGDLQVKMSGEATRARFGAEVHYLY